MPDTYVYISALIIAICGLAVIDRKYTLAFWFDARRTWITLLTAEAVFIVWDVLGIRMGIFFVGTSKYITGIRLAPELPIEEIFFLFLLVYNALILWRLGGKWWHPTQS